MHALTSRLLHAGRLSAIMKTVYSVLMMTMIMGNAGLWAAAQFCVTWKTACPNCREDLLTDPHRPVGALTGYDVLIGTNCGDGSHGKLVAVCVTLPPHMPPSTHPDPPPLRTHTHAPPPPPPQGMQFLRL